MIKAHQLMLSLLIIVELTALPAQVRAQSLNNPETSAGIATNATPDRPVPTYTRPTRQIRLRNYAFDAIGPYPIVGAAAVAAVDQAYNAPPEWNQGAAGFGRRFGSDFGIAAVSTTTRYALAEAFKEDTLYYRCECTGLFPRLNHAVVSTFTARRGRDGHRVFSIPSLVAPYAGTMTAVYGWYPNRFGAQDAFRMGNYNLLGYVGENIIQEFFFSVPHSLRARMHLNNTHGAPDSGSKQ